MKDYNKNEYNREYNKETYKTVKVYIREEEYPKVISHMEKRGYTKLSGYIKDLIHKDMNEPAEEKSAGKNINIGNNKGIVIGDDNNGTINIKK